MVASEVVRFQEQPDPAAGQAAIAPINSCSSGCGSRGQKRAITPEQATNSNKAKRERTLCIDNPDKPPPARDRRPRL